MKNKFVLQSIGNLKQIFYRAYQQHLKDSGEVHCIKSFDLARILRSESMVKITGRGWEDGAVSPLERLILALIIKYKNPSKILEIGTYRGATSRLFLDNCSDECDLYTVDLPIDKTAMLGEDYSDERLIRLRQVGIEFSDHEKSGNVHQILGNTFDDSTWKNIPDGFDFAFIDASHTYEAVKNDTEHVFKKLNKNAIIAWHDYSDGFSQERGVGKYLRELMKKNKGVFICEGTSLGISIPFEELKTIEEKAIKSFINNDYSTRRPKTIYPWFTKK